MKKNKSLPKVSIIVPIHNVEKYLKECVNSILNQSYKDFELILINDGSADKSGDICDEYKKKYDNIKVIHQKNQGQAVARNNGVKLSQAEWIMFVDSDDVIHPNLLEYLYRAVTESDSGMAVSERFELETLPLEFFSAYEFEYQERLIDKPTLEEYYISGEDAYWAPFPSIIKREILLSVPFPEGRIYEDNAVGCQFLYFAKKIAKIPYKMYFYRKNPNGTMNQPFSIKRLDYLWALEFQIEFYKQINYKNLVQQITGDLLEIAFHYYNVSIKEENKEVQKAIKKRIKEILKKYREFIVVDERIKNKCLKIYHPFLFKLKKRLNR